MGKKASADKRKSRSRIVCNQEEFKIAMIAKDKERVAVVTEVMTHGGTLSDIAREFKSRKIGGGTLLALLRRLAENHNAFGDIVWCKTRPCNWKGVRAMSERYEDIREVK